MLFDKNVIFKSKYIKYMSKYIKFMSKHIKFISKCYYYYLEEDQLHPQCLDQDMEIH